MRLATVDVGTNAAKLLIADVEGTGALRCLLEQRRMIRLGEGVDSSGVIRRAAMERLIASLTEFECLAAQFGAHEVLVAGTSASRDASGNLVESVAFRTGLQYEILSGDEEADLSFWGAVSDLPEITGTCVTCDIGGGSTEIVLGGTEGTIEARYSLDIGSVRVTERFFTMQPPLSEEIEQATAFIRRALGSCKLAHDKPIPLVGASDTHRLLLKLVPHNPESSKELSLDDIVALQKSLLSMREEEVLELNANELSGRADVFPAAVLICSEVMRHLNKESVIVSGWGLCHGLALRAAQELVSG